MKIAVRLSRGLLFLLLAACEDPVLPSVATIEIQPAVIVNLSVGETIELTATPLNAAGRPVKRSVVWSVDDPSIARIDRTSGRLTALSIGYVRITAQAGSAVVEVTHYISPEVVALSVHPQDMTVGVARALRLAATYSQGGQTFTTSHLPWESSDSTIARVSWDGEIVGVREGTATIRVRHGGKVAGTAVSVAAPIRVVEIRPPAGSEGTSVPVGETLQLAAHLFTDSARTEEARGRRQIVWTTTDSYVASVSKSGLVTGVSRGGATITATSEGISRHWTVEVVSTPVTLVLSPRAVALVPGDPIQFSAVVRDASGAEVPDPRALSWSWSVSDPEVARLSWDPSFPERGAVIGVAVGTTTLRVTVDGLVAEAVLTVRSPVAEVRLEPATLTLGAGEAQRLTPILRDAGGDVLDGREVRWTTSDLSVARVSAEGIVTGGVGGTADVTATVEGKSATARITVTAAAPSPPGPWASVAAGSDFTCALTHDGKAHCWGEGRVGQLGFAIGGVTGTPRAVETELRFRSLSAGEAMACGVTAEDEAYCWGGEGERNWVLRREAEGFHMASYRVGTRGARCGVATDSSIVCGDQHLPDAFRATTARRVAVTAEGDVVQHSWSEGWRPVGIGSPHGDSRFVAVDGEEVTACALRTDGRGFCTAVQTGLSGSRTDIRFSDLTPVPGTLELSRITAGRREVCGLTEDRRAYCWRIVLGDLSAGHRIRLEEPVLVSETLRFTQVSAGAEHTCAVTAEGAAYCWGSNRVGQLGIGVVGGESTGPARVRDP